MIIRCPTCGSQNSLEVLVQDEIAAKLLVTALNISPIGNLLIAYIGLFRPLKAKKLTWLKVSSLLNELLPLIKAEKITRKGTDFNAPLKIWEIALTKVIDARNAGTLQTPLKSHGYLFEIMISEDFKASGLQVINPKTSTHQKPKQLSNTALSIQALQNLKD